MIFIKKITHQQTKLDSALRWVKTTFKAQGNLKALLITKLVVCSCLGQEILCMEFEKTKQSKKYLLLYLCAPGAYKDGEKYVACLNIIIIYFLYLLLSKILLYFRNLQSKIISSQERSGGKFILFLKNIWEELFDYYLNMFYEVKVI